MQSIPLIDLGDTASVNREIEKACLDIGFMYVVGHGIPSRRIDDVRTSVIRYFAVPRFDLGTLED
jgi:isopenicillin N synthase-like dioxygenase